MSAAELHYRTNMSFSTVAVSFANGTVIPVAKIEGSQAYKDEMLRILYSAPGRFIDQSPGWTSEGFEDGGMRELTFEERSHPIPPAPPEDDNRMWKLVETVNHYYRWYAPWVKFTLKRTPLDTMLQDLKTYTEVLLGRQIQVVEVSVPLSLDVGTDQRHFDLDIALQRTRLKRSHLHPENAAIAAIHGSTVSKKGYLLCIDYSRSGLIVTALADHFAGGELGVHRAIYRPDLGASFEEATPDFWEQVRREVKRSLENWDFDMVTHYVLIGDYAASAPRLLEIVNSMWEIRKIQDNMWREDKSQIDYVDPIFAAAIGMAKMGQLSMAMDETEFMTYSDANKTMNLEEGSKEL
jgi:hypothetical protein